jgi:hypothetical protein
MEWLGALNRYPRDAARMATIGDDLLVDGRATFAAANARSCGRTCLPPGFETAH